jgi:hypothetical protein
MLDSANEPEETPERGVDNETLRNLKHDINNQLSNILLAIEQLRYELADATDDCAFYLDAIAISSSKINELLKAVQ